MEEIRKSLRFIFEHGLYPEVEKVSGCTTSPYVNIDGRRVLLACSNDYLGLASSPIVKRAAQEAIEKYGVGSGGSRLVSGNADIQAELERLIADFKGGEAAITFSTGYMANIGTIPAVADVLNISSSGERFQTSPFSRTHTIIFADEFCHASVFDGCRLSRARTIAYAHKDMADLETKLKKHGVRRKLIVTEGVFSMDGDIAPLPDIIKLAKQYGALTMIDDAHGTGVLGKHGRGTIEHFGLAEDAVDIVMGTFTKAFGAVGGFVIGNKELVDYLRATSRPYIFSAPIPPSISASIIAAITVAKNNPELRDHLWENSAYLRTSLQKIGFNTLSSETQIIPVLIGDEKKCAQLSRELLDSGILAPCIRWPAVPWGKSRIRLIARATNTQEHIDYLLQTMGKIGVKLELLNRANG